MATDKYKQMSIAVLLADCYIHSDREGPWDEARRRLERGAKALELLGKIINSRTHGIQTTPGYGNSVEGQYLEEARSLLAEEAPDATS